MTAKISLTFDYWVNDLTSVWGNMSGRGFRGTYFLAPEQIESAGDPLASPTKDHVTLIKMQGHEIGIYTNVNMVDLLASNRTTAYAKIKSLKDDMYMKGFPVESVAPNGRAWSQTLANMSIGFYNQVRAGAGGSLVQTLPISNPLNFNGGTFASLGSAVPVQDVKDAIDAAIAADGLIPFVLHKIGTVSDPYTYTYTQFNEVLDYLQSKGSAVEVIPFGEAVKG